MARWNTPETDPVASPLVTAEAILRANADSAEVTARTNAIAAAISGLAPLASPTFTGNPTVPTQSVGNSTTRAASTAYVQGEVALDRARLDSVESSSPSAGQKAALAGTNGTPGSGNRYVTASDPAIGGAAAFYATVVGVATADDRAQVQTQIDAANTAYVADGIERTIRLRGKFTIPQGSAPFALAPDVASYGRKLGLAIRPGVHLYAEQDATLFATQADLESFIGVLPSGTPLSGNPAMGGDHWSIKGVIFDCNQTSGAEFNGGFVTIASSDDWAITDCLFKRSRGDVLTIVTGTGHSGPRRWKFERNEIDHIAGQTILVQVEGDPFTDASIVDNYSHDGITVAETYAINGPAALVGRRIVFARNRMFNTGTCGFAKCAEVTIAANYLQQPVGSQGACLNFGGSDFTISGNMFDSSLAFASGANYPITGSANNVVITGNILKSGFTGAIKGGGANWTVQGNNIQSVAGGSGDTAVAQAIDIGGVTLSTIGDNMISGLGPLNSIVAGDDARIHDNHLSANGMISAGARAKVHDNTVVGAPLNTGGQTFWAISVGALSLVHHNTAKAGTTGGMILAGAGSRVTDNKLENTYVGGNYTNVPSGIVRDNIGIATAAVGGTDGDIGDTAANLVESVNAVAAAGAAQTIPAATVATISRLVLNAASCTLTFPAAAAGKSFTLVLVQDGTGSRIVAWPGGVLWAGGGAPTLTTAANKRDVFSFVCADGTNWLGFVAGQNL